MELLHICVRRTLPWHDEAAVAAAIPSHVRASEHFDANPALVKRLDASLSLQNRNLASRTTLAEGAPELTRGGLLDKYRRFRAFYDRVRLPCEVAWANPSVVAMAELMHDLRPK